MSNGTAIQIPRPVVKWVGGKRGIVDTLMKLMPEDYGDYWEPFVGGGALFFALHPNPHRAHISDVNDDLMNMYRTVKRSKNKLMAELDVLSAFQSEDFYYAIRAEHNINDPALRAARFVFINKLCYNGLIRYNSKGQINTPWGHKKNPVTLYDRENINAVAAALKGVEIATRSYDKIEPSPGDFVYFDPPYHDAYNSYSKNGFGDEGQAELASFFRALDARGVLLMLSNSDTPLIRELYDGFNVREITAPRAVSCKGDGRKPVSELIVTNYEVAHADE